MGFEELTEQRNMYHTGGYQGAIRAGASLGKVSEEVTALSKIYTYRAYIAQQMSHLVLAEIKDDDSTPLHFKAVRALAEYTKGDNREEIMQKVLNIADSLSVAVNKGELYNASCAIISSILIAEKKTDEARAILERSKDLECKYLLFHLFLNLDRPDISEKVMKEMNSIDGDDILSQLAFAQLALVAGGDKAQEAFLTISELVDRYGSTPLLLNLLAIAQMKLARWDDATKTLMESMEKSNKDPETLVNLIVCSVHTHQSKDVIARYTAQLQTLAPEHPFFTQLKSFEESFDKACEKFQ